MRKLNDIYEISKMLGLVKELNPNLVELNDCISRLGFLSQVTLNGSN